MGGSGSEVFSAGTASIGAQQQQPKDAEEEEGIATINSNSNKPSPRMTSRSRLGGLTSSSGIRSHHPQTGDNSMNQQQQQELSLQHQGDDEGSTASTWGPSGAVTVAFEHNEDMRRDDKRDRSFSQQSQNSELAEADKNIEMDKIPQSGSKDNDQSLEKNHVTFTDEAQEKPEAPESQAPSRARPMEVGEVVLCRYKTSRRWYEAVITKAAKREAAAETYTVRYTDGEVEEGIIRRRLKREGEIEVRELALGDAVDAKCAVCRTSDGVEGEIRHLVLPGKIAERIPPTEEGKDVMYVVEFDAFDENLDGYSAKAGRRETVNRRHIFALYVPLPTAAAATAARESETPNSPSTRAESTTA